MNLNKKQQYLFDWLKASVNYHDTKSVFLEEWGWHHSRKGTFTTHFHIVLDNGTEISFEAFVHLSLEDFRLVCNELGVKYVE